MDNGRKKKAAVIIHSFAVANAAVGAVLANTVVGDMPFVTVLNVAMIYRVGKLFDVGTTYSDASAAAGTLFASATKTYLASRLIVWIPIAGNIVNAGVIFGLTELVGWMAFVLFKEGKDVSGLSKEELRQIKIRAEIEKIDLRSEIGKLPPEVRTQYEALENQLKNKKLSEEEREAIIDQMIALIEPHIDV